MEKDKCYLCFESAVFLIVVMCICYKCCLLYFTRSIRAKSHWEHDYHIKKIEALYLSIDWGNDLP